MGDSLLDSVVPKIGVVALFKGPFAYWPGGCGQCSAVRAEQQPDAFPSGFVGCPPNEGSAASKCHETLMVAGIWQCRLMRIVRFRAEKALS